MKKSKLFQCMFCIPFLFLSSEQVLVAQVYPSSYEEEFAMLDIHIDYMHAYGNIDSMLVPDDGVNPEIKLNPAVELNTIFTGHHILFNYRDHTLSDDSKLILNKVAEVIKKNPTAVFKVSAYTDARGNADDNLRLSMDRAQSTVYYLLSKGVSSDQLIAEGHGENDLIVVCEECSENDHAMNRRVEIRLVTIHQ